MATNLLSTCKIGQEERGYDGKNLTMFLLTRFAVLNSGNKTCAGFYVDLYKK
jgi:hypothetical protein